MIVVTTPTGQIGGQLVDKLAAAGESSRVIVRDAGKLRGNLPPNIEVIEGSHGDATTINRALEGADALFWCVPPTPLGTMADAYSGFSRPAVEAVARLRTARVVVVSALGRGTPWQERAGLVTASLHMVDLFRETGAAVRGLAMPGFMENTLMQQGAIRAGQLFGPIDPDRKLPHTATRDMATVAARLLLDRSWSGQDDLPVLGPEDLSFDEIAAIVSDAIGREVRYHSVPFDAFKAQLLERGMPADFAEGYVTMMRAKNEGMDNVVERTPATTGETSFRTWAETVLKPMIAG